MVDDIRIMREYGLRAATSSNNFVFFKKRYFEATITKTNEDGTVNLTLKRSPSSKAEYWIIPASMFVKCAGLKQIDCLILE